MGVTLELFRAAHGLRANRISGINRSPVTRPSQASQFFLFTQYYRDDPIGNDEMGGACTTHGSEKK